MRIRVLVVGLGPIGASVARQVVARKPFQLVGAVDIDPQKIGLDAGRVIGTARPLRVKITDRIGPTIKFAKPDVAILCTSSSLKSVIGQLEEVLKHRVPIVTTTEEAAYPSRSNRRVAARLDSLLGGDGEARSDQEEPRRHESVREAPRSARTASPPGIDRFYSGVTKSTASTAAMAFLNSTATGG